MILQLRLMKNPHDFGIFFENFVIVYTEKRNRQLALKLPFNFDLVNLKLPIVREKSFFPEEKGELVDQEGHLQGTRVI